MARAATTFDAFNAIAEPQTKEQRDEIVERYGAIERGHQTLGRLAVYVAELRANAGSP